MNEKEIQENLSDIFNNSKFITLATIDEDGWPRCTPLGWFAFDKQKEQIVFDNHSTTTHAENLTRDPRCFITIVNKDQPRSRSVNIKTLARKLIGDEYKRAKKLILDKDLNISDNIFAAPVGEIDIEKSRIELRSDGSKRFYCYMTYKEEE